MISYMKKQILNLSLNSKEKKEILDIMKQTLIYILNIQDIRKKGLFEDGVFNHEFQIEHHLLNISMNIIEVYVKQLDYQKYQTQYNDMVHVLYSFREYLNENALTIGIEEVQNTIDY